MSLHEPSFTAWPACVAYMGLTLQHTCVAAISLYSVPQAQLLSYAGLSEMAAISSNRRSSSLEAALSMSNITSVGPNSAAGMLDMLSKCPLS